MKRVPLLRARWAVHRAVAADLAVLATRALRARGLTWGDVARALFALAAWAGFALVCVHYLAEVVHGA